MNKIVFLNDSTLKIASGILRWHISRYIFRRDFPLLATFQLTNICNFNCRMCNIKNNPEQGTLPFDRFRRIIDELSAMGTVYATLSGGEPLLIGDILDYVSYARSRVPFVNLVTNGWLLNENIAAGIGRCGLDSLSVSIDALQEKHDRIRGMPGAFKKAVHAINLVKKYSPTTLITVNTVISAWNLDDIPALAEEIARLGARQKFQPVYEHPDFGGRSVPRVDHAAGMDIAKVEKVVSYLLKKKHVANSKYYLSCIPDSFAGRYDKPIFRQNCGFASFCCEFTQDGMMFPCIVGKEWRGGYDTNKGLLENLRSKEYRREVKDLQKCRLCRKNFSVCYVETRLTLPVTNFLRYNLLFR